MCGSPCASAPPTVATLRTRTFDSRSIVRVITGAARATSAECSSAVSGVIAPIVRLPSAPALMPDMPADLAQADEPGRAKHARLHHQHQRGAAAERAHRGIVGVEQAQRLLERRGLDQIEWRHCVSPAANAARKRSVNFFSISLALALSTGWPMLPSLPASVESIE